MLLIDGSSLVSRVLHTPQGDLQDSAGRWTGGLHGFMVSLAALCEKRKHREGIICCWDMGVPIHRRDLYSEYKPNNKPIGDHIDRRLLSKINLGLVEADDSRDPTYLQKYHFTVTTLHNIILPFTGSISVRVENCEADDIIATWTRHVPEQITILSPDNDLYQLLSENCDQFNARDDYFISKESLIKDKGLSPKRWREEFLLTKALCGDVNDGVPGILGVGAASVTGAAGYCKQLITKLRDDEQISKGFLSNNLKYLVKPPRAREAGFNNLKNSSEEIFRNYCLVDLYHIFENNLPLAKTIKQEISKTFIYDIDEDSILEKLDEMELSKTKETIFNIIESNLSDPPRKHLKNF